MILNLRVKNFKSIQDSDTIKLKPLTIFTGPNSSGKSNILEAIAVLAQVARLPADITPTLRQSLVQGEFFKYPRPAMEFITHRKEIGRPISFDIKFKLEDSEKRFLQTKVPSIRYSYSRTHIRGRPDATEVRQGMFLGEEVLIEVEHRETRGRVQSRVVDPPIMSELSVSRGNEILLAKLFDDLQKQVSRPDTQYSDVARGYLESAIAGSEVLSDKFRRIYPISAARGIVPPEVRIRERGGRERYMHACMRI